MMLFTDRRWQEKIVSEAGQPASLTARATSVQTTVGEPLRYGLTWKVFKLFYAAIGVVCIIYFFTMQSESIGHVFQNHLNSGIQTFLSWHSNVKGKKNVHPGKFHPIRYQEWKPQQKQRVPLNHALIIFQTDLGRAQGILKGKYSSLEMVSTDSCSLSTIPKCSVLSKYYSWCGYWLLVSKWTSWW